MTIPELMPRDGVQYSLLQLAQDGLHRALLSHYAHSRKVNPS